MKYKKSLLTIGSIAALTTPIAAVVSCGFDFGSEYTRRGGKVVIITDHSSVFDHAFNEAAKTGVTNWTTISKEKWSYIVPSKLNRQIFQKAYREALNNGADTLVLPGYHHAFYGEGNIGANYGAPDDVTTPWKNEKVDATSGLEAKFPHKNFIGIDISDSNSQNNVYALNFKTSQSGFMAAIYAGMYMNKKDIIIGEKLKFAGYGGLNISTVTPFLDGFLQGANWFNKHKPLGNSWKEMEPVFAEGSKPSSKDFSGGFDPGLATGLSTKYLNKGAQIILSVAGPQSADTVGAIKRFQKANTFVIGPDTDQSLIYDPKIVLGSMMKGIADATTDTLNKIYGLETPKDMDYFFRDNISSAQPGVIDENTRTYVGFQPSIAILENEENNKINKDINNDSFYKEAEAYLYDEVEGDKDTYKVFDAGHNNIDSDGNGNSIDIAAKTFINGNEITSSPFANISSLPNGTTIGDYAIVSDIRTAETKNSDKVKADEKVEKMKEAANSKFKDAVNALALELSTTPVALIKNAEDAIRNNTDVPIKGIRIWDGSKWVEELKSVMFAGGFYGAW